MTSVLAVVTATVVGLMVGVEFAVAVVTNPILSRMPEGAALVARADGARMLGRVMPLWYAGSLLLTAAFTAVTWGTPTAMTTLVATLLLAVSVVLSVALLVPLNNRSRTWTAECHPDDWRAQHQRWDRLHYVRVAIIVVSFVLVVAAATTL